MVRVAFASAGVDRLVADWTTTPESADAVVRGTLKTLRARSRERYRNDDYAKRFIAMIRSNVIGPRGIGLQARVRDFAHGPDTPANDAIESTWKEWGRKETCDIAGRLSWVDMQRLFVSTVAMDGEAIVRLHEPAGNPFHFAVQMIDAELLDLGYNRELADGARIKMGIEVDAYSRPLAYYLIQDRANGNGTQWYGKFRVRVPAEEIIHAFIPELVGQSRGLPWMGTSMLRMKMLVGYQDASLVAARVGAAKMGLLRREEGGEGYVGTDEEKTGEQVIDVEPGTFQELPRGVSIDRWEPEYPKGEFPDFVKASLRGIASGLGVAYNTLANDLEGVNYSSIRAGVLEDREFWKAIQEWTVETLCRPIYDRWLGLQLTAGTISVPDKQGVEHPLPPSGEAKFRRVAWQPRRWAWVDPLKDMQANETGIALGIVSRSQVIRDQGDDPEEVWREIAQENELIETLGLKFQTIKASPTSGPGPEGGGND